MRIAIIEPLLTGHKQRGIGIYTENLKKTLEYLHPGEITSAKANKLPKDCDLYHFPYFDPFFLTLPIWRSETTVITIHDLIPIRFPKAFPRGIRGEIKWQVQRILAKGVDAIITDSQASKEDISKYIGIDEKKIYPIYLAPDNIFFKKTVEKDKEFIRNKYNLPQQFALFVGDINWNKNLVNIIRAIKKINFPLVIVSKNFNKNISIINNPWLSELIQARKEIENSKLFTVLNNISQSDLPHLYQIAKVFLYPSRYEGFGLPVLEAFASQCPVITTNKGSLREITGDAAFIIDPESPDALAAAINKINNDAGLVSSLRQQGRRQAQQFTWEKTAKQTYDIYLQVLNKKIASI